ncbi:unnamed protein product [Chilo suppressalis]|uniref:DNA primase large subunit C-terminal domain-containing protein n=1 Tax=Chilo suppressalis TaxID=168631 RepID=A0ABN8AXZ0_CHISP|nr:unnamed protein product [Chilo suppressalis]
MSFFYLTAVKGDIPSHLLETIAFERLHSLKEILNTNKLYYNEYLVEGGIYDNVGHFLVCILTILCKNIELKRFLLKTECILFKRRLDSLSAYELRYFAKRLLRSIKKYQHCTDFIEPLKISCEHLILKDVAHHICLESHKFDCKVHNICLNFKYCLPLVAKREVELKNGVAFIPCSKWKQFLTILFFMNLSQRLNKTNVEVLVSDPRILDLLDKLKGQINPLLRINHSRQVLYSTQVDKQSQNFPPCMLNLHQQLRKRHRLPHTQRFYYSLFLKDIGMPVDEAVNFWRTEYQQMPNGTHSCCHNWEKDEKKFVYGIRHMYGLEGCRKSYSSVNCHRIQSEDNSCNAVGCPFKIFEHERMLHILNMDSTEPILSQIYELKSRYNYTAACMKYMQSKHLVMKTKCDIENATFNFTPVKFYDNASMKSNDVI